MIVNLLLFMLGVAGVVMSSLLILVANFGVSVNPVFVIEQAGVSLLVAFAFLVLVLNRWRR